MVTLQEIKKITSEKQAAKIAEQLAPLLKYQLIEVSKTLEKMDYATTDNNNYGQFSDLKKAVDSMLIDEFDFDIDTEEA